MRFSINAERQQDERQNGLEFRQSTNLEKVVHTRMSNVVTKRSDCESKNIDGSQITTGLAGYEHEVRSLQDIHRVVEVVIGIVAIMGADNDQKFLEGIYDGKSSPRLKVIRA